MMENQRTLFNLFNNRWFIIALISVAAVVPYLNIFNNTFAYDDSDYFLRWEGIKSINISSFFSGDAPMHYHHVYRPIRSIIQSIIYQFSSTNPFGYHLFALAVHLLATFLIYLIAKRISNKIIALVSAIIFALLPVHTMSITFILAIFSTVGLVFLLLSFYLYILFGQSHHKKYFYLSLAAALLAFFTYELALILPLLIILYDVCIKNLTKKQFKSYAKYYLFYFLEAILFLIIRYSILGKIYKGPFLIEIDFFNRMLTMSKAFVRYIYLTIFNYPLSVHYDTEIANSLFDIKVLASLLTIFGLIGLAIFFYKRNLKIYTFIIFWFFISLIPVANIVPIAFFVSEQYLYLASFAWTLLLGIIFYKLYCSFKEKKQGLITSLLIVLIMLCLVYGYLTWSRNKDWRNDLVLWTSVLARQPNSVKAHNNLAFYYRNEENYRLAQEHLQKALEINPEYSLAYVNLGEVYMDQEQFEQAIEYFKKAISLRPNYAASYHNLGFSYHNLGQVKEAEENYQKAIEIYPQYYQSNKNLAVLYLAQERYDEAMVRFKRALELQKNDYESYFGLGLSYLYQGEKTLAKEYFQKALEINPRFTPAQEKLNQL